MANDKCATGATNAANIIGLQRDVKRHDHELANMRALIEQYAKRPTWLTLAIITFLSNICIALIIYTLSHHMP